MIEDIKIKERQLAFIAKSNEVHNNRYSYLNVEYIDSKTKVAITCNIHGDFLQSPNHHTSGGKGCPICNKRNQGIDGFLAKANIKHGNKYDYSKVKYVNVRTKVNITCLEHGDFLQTPHAHLAGQGCPQCYIDNKYKQGGWTYSNWEDQGVISPDFESYKVYILKCCNENESEIFYKIGKTFLPIKKRYGKNNKSKLPYNYEVIYTQVGDAREISELERKLQKDNKDYKYMPKIKFKGMFECFSEVTLQTKFN